MPFRDFHLPDDCCDPSNFLPHLPEAGGVVELVGGKLEAQVEQLRLGFGQLGGQLVGIELAEFGGVHPSSLVRNRVLMGSL